VRKNTIPDEEWQHANKLFDSYWREGRTLKSLAAEHGYKESALRYRLQTMKRKHMSKQHDRLT
jgi:hypothetical protein